MTFELYKRYTIDEALEILQPEQVSAYCDDQFYVANGNVLAFLVVHRTPRRTNISLRDTLEWVTKQPYPNINTLFDKWLPDDLELKPRPNIHMFARQKYEEFTYLGLAYLISYSENGRGQQGTFHLRKELGDDLWKQVGSYPEIADQWVFTINGERCESQNWLEIEHRLESLNTNKESKIYAFHAQLKSWLTVMTTGNRAYVKFWSLGNMPGQIAHDPNASAERVIRFAQQSDNMELTEVQTLPQPQALDVVRHVVTTGNLPEWVDWR